MNVLSKMGPVVGNNINLNSFGAMVPYMAPIFVIRYAMRRRKTVT